MAVLVVEDEALLSMTIADELEQQGYEVLTAATADAAIRILEAPNDIRTIFTDVDLPGSMDGLKLAAAVRYRWPPVNIVITTGMNAPQRSQMPAGSVFVAKPYRSVEVLNAIRQFE